jgi:2-keto-4-pentenoate hydratase
MSESNTFEAAARLLVETRRSGRVLSALPDPVAPRDVAEGYAVQDAFRRLWPDKLAGWKAGATAAAIQQKLGVTEPIIGPFFANDTFVSPARLPAARFPHLCLESEFAFRFGWSLPARSHPYSREEIVAAVDALVPAFEIVGPRFDSLLFGRAPTAIGDCVLNSGFVLGQPVTDWRSLDLVNHKVKLTVAGALRAEGTGAAVLGDPIAALVWTVQHLGRRAIAIEAGQIISTGTTTGLAYIQPGQQAVADFGVLGTVDLVFVGPVHPQNVSPP